MGSIAIGHSSNRHGKWESNVRKESGIKKSSIASFIMRLKLTPLLGVIFEAFGPILNIIFLV